MLARYAIRSSSAKWVRPECAFRPGVAIQPHSKLRLRGTHETTNYYHLRQYATQGGQSQVSNAINSCSKSTKERWYATTSRTSNFSSTSLRFFSAVPTPRPAQSINSPSPIPQSTLGLHSALRELELQAANYISLARVKLAIKSVETGLRGTTRIAVLALSSDGKQSVKRLLRLVFADVLNAEKDWEKQLLEQNDGRGVLIKYGENNGEHEFWNTLLRTVYVDSPLLKSRGMEILISTMDVHVGQASVSSLTGQRSILDTFLVPMAETTATEAGGGLSVVSYPVHKTVLVAGGLEELVELGRFEVGIGGRVPNTTEMIKVVVNSNDGITSETGEVGAVNITAAEKGILSFREDLSKSLDYEHAWFKSGIPELSTWIFGDEPNVKETKLKHEIKVFIEALLSDASTRIDANERTISTRLQALDSIDESIRNDLTQGAETWERRAHEELQTSLESVFLSPMWKKLAWWKLLWRVDDIGMIGFDVLKNHWLVRAEKELIYLFGRMKEAKFLDEKSFLLSQPITFESSNNITESDSEQPISDANITPLPPTSASLYPDLPVPSPPLIATPYPTQITSVRASLTNNLLDLQAKAQSLLLTSLSTTAIGAAFAALIHVSSPLITIFESGAIAAFGLALAIVRLQSGWDKERKKFEDIVKESGRTALISTGSMVKEVVVAGGRTQKVDLAEMEMEQIIEARKAVQGVRDALSIMGEK